MLGKVILYKFSLTCPVALKVIPSVKAKCQNDKMIRLQNDCKMQNVFGNPINLRLQSLFPKVPRFL